MDQTQSSHSDAFPSGFQLGLAKDRHQQGLSQNIHPMGPCLAGAVSFPCGKTLSLPFKSRGRMASCSVSSHPW